MRLGGARSAVAVLAGVVLAGVLAACAPASPPVPVSDPGTSTELTMLSATTGSDAAIVDAHGRAVQLRGANLNHLGDYFVSDPRLPTVAPLADDDWDDLAAAGFDVVRLVTSWSAWQPERGSFDLGYLARVRGAVAEANERGIYVVIDMHQDAWSRVVHTPRDETCPEGTRPQVGWDGAPQWATSTDGRPTCTPGSREESPAVIAAWDAFYADRDGVRTALADLWGRIAAEFAGEAGVAGFDLLNEPGYGSDVGATVDGLGAFYRQAISAIRAAEDAAAAEPHLVFFEPTVNGLLSPDPGDEPNLVWAPHLYAESIGPSFPGLLDVAARAYALLGDVYGTPVWIGEYGSFADPATNQRWMERFASLHDSTGMSGGAWWQWEQECGDPHDVSGVWPPDDAWVEARLVECDGGRMDVACRTRSYPRAVPGRLTSLAADPCGGPMVVSGSTPAPSTADLWYAPVDGPAAGGQPVVTGEGVGEVTAVPAGHGWRVFVGVSGDYRVEVRAP